VIGLAHKEVLYQVSSTFTLPFTSPFHTVNQLLCGCFCYRAMTERKRDASECITLLLRACEKHQMLYRDAMCGRGVDRHLFGLFVICKGLGQVRSQHTRSSDLITGGKSHEIADCQSFSGVFFAEK